MVSKHDRDADIIAASVASSTLYEEVPADAVDSWQFYLVGVAHHLRSLVGDDPEALRVLIDPPRIANWVRPPVGNVPLAETFLATLVGYGFSDEDAVAFYLTFFTRVLGLLCAHATSSASPAAKRKLVDVSTYPTLARLSPLLGLDQVKDDFDAAIDDILISLERDLLEPGSHLRTG